jgi:hypothetical protein
MKKTLVLASALTLALSTQLFAAPPSAPSPLSGDSTAEAPRAALSIPSLTAMAPNADLASRPDENFALWLTTRTGARVDAIKPCGPFGCQHGAGVCCQDPNPPFGYYCDLSGTCA